MTYVDILMIGLSGSLLAYFYGSLLSEGMLLEKLGKRLEGKFWAKPFGGCAYCTAPYLTVMMMLFWLYLPTAWDVISIIVLGYYLLNILFKFEE